MDNNKQKKSDQNAAELIRGKLDRIYASEPSAQEEIDEVKSIKKNHLSKHQKYMDELSKSGRGLAEIQTAWHEYYQQLPDPEKHEVWREFYQNHEKKRPVSDKSKKSSIEQQTNAFATASKQRRLHKPAQKAPIQKPHARIDDPKTDLLQRVAKRSQRSKKSAHAHSLLFGLGVGTFVLFILMFTFFNERFITPFIRPSVNVSATPIIVDPNQDGPVSAESKIIIPKINVEAPVVFDEPSIDEKAIQKALERGVVHYAITPEPGEFGNSVIVGHSSSNILNNGRYKFAFLLLKSLENGDTFIVHKDKKRYVYKVYNKFVTDPKDVSVLAPPTDGKKAIMTLVTCDPPGLSTNRLIIQAEQIFPDPSTNKESSANPNASTNKEPEELPSNAPSLWSRLINNLFN